MKTQTATTVTQVNKELGGFKSLATSATAMPLLVGLNGKVR
jgi:hypothetical protein